MHNKRIKIGFLYFGDPSDVKYWSGTVSSLFTAIQQSSKFEVQKIIVTPNRFSSLAYKIVRIFSLKKNELSFIYNLLDMKKANKAIKESQCDVIFAPACSKLLYSGKRSLKGKRLFYMSDATYHKMLGYYYNHSKHDQTIGNKWEQNVHNMAEKIIIPSYWAFNDAVDFYNTPSDKICVLKFGANLSDTSHKVVKNRKSSYKLLLVGVDWKRKGIDIAIDCVNRLNQQSQSIKYELSIIGVKKPEDKYPEYIHFYGRLDKNNPEEKKRLIDAYMEHDIFIMPTKAECAGIVFAEAAMFGLPVFTYATGGTVDYVEDRVTGRCLDINCNADDFKNAIMECIENDLIQDYSINAREKYEKELNWGVWQKNFEELF